MLIDDTQPEETRVVIIDGNKVEDVEFESSFRKQIKGNIYTAKVIRVEPSLQAAFIDYGGNKHGFLAFGEIHPDYYTLSPDVMAAIDQEVDEIIERKKQYLKEREEQRERIRQEKQAQYEARKQAAEENAKAKNQTSAIEQPVSSEPTALAETAPQIPAESSADAQPEVGAVPENNEEKTSQKSPRGRKQFTRRRKVKSVDSASQAQSAAENSSADNPAPNKSKDNDNSTDEIKVLAARSEHSDPRLNEDNTDAEPDDEGDLSDESDDDVSPADIDDDDIENDFELQRRLIKARKLYHNHAIQDVIKEGQTLLIQVVKEERGNKGAACTTYLSLAGRYCVLMPNRIKSGGVSRKITNASDRKRLKEIIKALPLTPDMSMIVRTAGEDKTQADIVRDYNYLIRTWNHIRLNSLKNKVPSLIYEEGDLIKRALRDMYNKEISEVIVDGEQAYQVAHDFVKILSPNNLKKIKCRKQNEMPVFQRFQIEAQLDKLHNPVVQLESGGYLVINPTEALVSIDVNSGRATKEKDIEETALKTNLEAADEIAKQLRMRNLAGLIVVDFIDMDEPKNNAAIEKRMKEALKNDRARIQVAKMSCFGLLEISRQRMHSSFLESNYQPCPFCHGQGVVRTTESGAMLILRAIEEEGTKNRSSRLTVFVPTDTAIYLLNQKRKNLNDLEQRYKLSIVISADNEIKNICDYRLERTKQVKNSETESDTAPTTTYAHTAVEEENDQNIVSVEKINDNTSQTVDNPVAESSENDDNNRQNRRFRGRRSRYDRRRNHNNGHHDYNNNERNFEKESPVILYSSHQDLNINKSDSALKNEKKEKVAWWRKLIG